MKDKKVIKSNIFLILLYFLYHPVCVSQNADEMKNIFTQAESYFIYEEYELANGLYLLIETPDNMNLKHKIGTCYLNIPGEKEKSVPYLEEASKSVDFNAKSESYKEMKAPPDVYFSLAKAYMINNEFEKALTVLENFSRITKQAGDAGKMENLEFIDQQILACRNALQYQQVPILFGKESLGTDFNLGSINENPAVSFDGSTIVYTERRGIENAIFFSKKSSGRWEIPVEITAELNAGTDCSSSSLNYDGTQLLLYKTDDYDGAIYISDFVDGKWTQIRKLNKNINTKYYESHAAFSADGKKLYFSSNRPGGPGNLDIYVSELSSSGDWGPAIGLGPEINTPFNEDTPFITKNDSVLYFCSEGHNSMGGYDIFKCIKSDAGWKTPSNLGYPVNSADDDKFFQPFNNGLNAYYSITSGYKKKDIFYLDMKKGESERPYAITGKFSVNDTLISAVKNASVKIINKVTGDTLYRCKPDAETGIYNTNVGAGLLRILYSGEGYLSQYIDTLIVPNFLESTISLDMTLLKDTTAPEPVVYEKINLSNIPVVSVVDSSILVKDMKVSDEGDKNVQDSEVLFYTVQVIALHKPVDASYFKYINDIKILYNDEDKFYRYTTGNFQTKDAAYKHREDLLKKGYPKQIFIKKVSK